MDLFDAFNIKKNIKTLDADALRKMIMSEAKRVIHEAMLSEKANPEKVDPKRFPLKLSDAQTDPDPESKVTGGLDDGETDEDKIDAVKGTLPVGDLKPSQSSMDIKKACQFFIAALRKVTPFPNGPGGDLGAIITSDDHIMDGHHRWIATGMVDPSASVGGFIVDFPAKQMIAALNMITASLGEEGKAGTGGFDQFNEQGVAAMLDKLATEGTWSGKPEEILAALKEFTQSDSSDKDELVAAAAKKVAENLSELTLAVPNGFPERPDMPVISAKAGHLKQAINLLKTGAVDLNPPYAEPANESVSSEKNFLTERWERLAGLLE